MNKGFIDTKSTGCSCKTKEHQQMNGTSSSFSEVRPDAGESQHFWSNIWSKDVLYNENEE